MADSNETQYRQRWLLVSKGNELTRLPYALRQCLIDIETLFQQQKPALTDPYIVYDIRQPDTFDNRIYRYRLYSLQEPLYVMYTKSGVPDFFNYKFTSSLDNRTYHIRFHFDHRKTRRVSFLRVAESRVYSFRGELKLFVTS